MANNAQSSTNRYKDLDLDMLPHPVSRDLRKKVDVAAVLRSCRHLVQIEQFEKPFRADIAAGLRQFLFEPIHPLTAFSISDQITRVLTAHEPRVIVLNVDVVGVEEENKYDITVELEIIGIPNPVTLQLQMRRLR